MSPSRKSFAENSATAIGAALVLLLGLVIIRYLLPDELLSSSSGHRYLLHLLPSGAGGHHNLLRYALLIAGVPLFLWLIGISIRR